MEIQVLVLSNKNFLGLFHKAKYPNKQILKCWQIKANNNLLYVFKRFCGSILEKQLVDKFMFDLTHTQKPKSFIIQVH